jgi:hypothetical protein
MINEFFYAPTVFTLPLERLCRNVILRSGATKNLLFGFVVSEHQRLFDTSTEEEQIL